MANLREQAIWEAGIYQLETSDPVMGGENGVDNRAPRQLANRTLWLKTELAKSVASISKNKTDGENTYARKSTVINAGAGLTGGGGLGDDLTIALGTPGKCSGSTRNWAGSNTHTHELEQANSQVAGVAKLINNLTSNDANSSLSAAMGKKLADEKMPVKTFDYHTSRSTDYSNSGFYRANGQELNGQILPSLEIHIAHPGYEGGRYARGIGFSYGTSWDITTTAWDENGNYRGKKTILTEDNGVMTTGNQNVGGIKTFDARADFAAGMRFSVASKTQWATLGMSAGDVYLNNPVSNKTLQLKDDGKLAYSNDKIMLLSDRSDAIDADDSDKFATAKAVKTLRDKTAATTSLVAQDLDSVTATGIYGQAANVNATTARHYPVQKAGTLLVAPSAYGVQQLYFPFNSQEIYNRNSRNNGGFEPWVKINVSPSEMTQAIAALERKLVDSSPAALDTLRELSAALNNNPNFATQILQQLGGKADKATTRAGYGITDASQVAVLTGQVDHGGTIPLPSGYSQAQCKWMVSMAHDEINPSTWDIRETGSYHHYYFKCFAKGSRVVTAQAFHGGNGSGNPDTDNSSWVNGKANYIIIGVK